MTFEQLLLRYFDTDGWTPHYREMMWHVCGAMSRIFPEADEKQMHNVGLLINVIFQMGREEVLAEQLEKELSYLPQRRTWPKQED